MSCNHLLPLVTLCGMASAPLAQLRNPDYEREFDQRYPIAELAALSIEHSMGPVTVERWEEDDVRVHARIEAKGKDAERFGQAVRFDVEETSSLLSVRTRFPDRSRSDISFGVSLKISMPKGHSLEVRNNFGNTSIAGIEGDVELRSSNGDVVLSEIRGKIRSRSSFGNVELSRSSGKVHIDGNNGFVRVEGHSQGSVTVDNSFGEIRILGAEGDLDLTCNNGEIEARDIGGSVRVVGSFGEQRFEDIRGGIDTRSSNGDVRASKIGGAVRIDTSFGRITLEDAAKDARLSASNGDVRVRRLSGSLELEGNFGKVDVEQSGSTEVSYGNGSVTLREIHGSARVDNSFGPVTLRDVEGDVFVRADNSKVRVLGLSATKKRKIDCTTSFGSLEVEVPLPASLSLDASASFGRIESNFQLKNLRRGNSTERCKCVLGEGELSVAAHVENGNVKLRGKRPERSTF